MSRLLLVAVVIALVVMSTRAIQVTSSSGNDATMTPGAKGADVVERTVEVIKTACVFDDDKLFMRRLAYVESFDGAKADTFRPGYDGGIWQVDKTMFDQIKSTPMKVALAKYTNQFKSSLNIDWQRISWSDCRKPRVSALAAQLFLQFKLDRDKKSFPRDIPAQGLTWSTYYRKGADKNIFVDAANKLNQGCNQIYGVDLAFVLDSSGSVGSRDFEKMKKFVADVVKSFDIRSNGTRVSVVRYSSSVVTEFYFNRYSDEKSVLNHVGRIKYTGGGTNTHLALSTLYKQIFTTTRGARSAKSGVPKVAIFLTDGHSNSKTKTITEALNVHKNDITMFAIGVGKSTSRSELEAIASDPECLYLLMLDGFSEMDSLKYAIKKGTCDAPIIVGPGKGGSEVEGKVPGGGDQNCKIKVPSGGTTIKINAKSGAVKFFVSSNTYPSESYHDARIDAVPGFPGVIYLAKPKTSDPEGITFCNIKGDDKIDSEVDVDIVPGDKDYCKAIDCKNGGKCVDDLVNGYKCFCAPGYEGTHCKNIVDPCKANPCNKGTCKSKSDGTYTCTCTAGWKGSNCNEAIDKCSSNPCKHGNCTALKSTYECCCEMGYTGVNCDKEVNECESSPCVHGVCDDHINKYTCICPPGYIGTHCEIDVDECASMPCVNGDCVDKVNSFKCICPPGWTGTHCEINIDECKSSPCMNGGRCVDKVNHYICDCKPGWTGVHCETDIDECESSPCIHGKCKNLINRFECVCDRGWIGLLCDTDFDECLSNPCIHGDCKNKIDAFQCDCHAGYTGVHCEIDIDECASSPCQHGATCLDRINSFVCECAPGYRGKLCEIDIDECETDPCEHGTCIDKVNDYDCKCQVGWTGKNCDCLIDNCEQKPCMYGICKNTVGGYTCTCNIGYTGPHCDKGNGGGSSDRGKYDCIKKNPCTAANRAMGRYYFEHTKAEKFVQCDAFGKCFVMPCAPSTKWDPSKLTCVRSP